RGPLPLSRSSELRRARSTRKPGPHPRRAPAGAQRARLRVFPVNDLDGDRSWYRTAVIYQAHVRAYRDESGDGIGDFRGLEHKLDYIQDLGVTAVWLLPFYPSPLRDGGYDISDYCGVHPAYGTMRDFRSFVRSAHARGIRVIAE